MVNEYLWKTTRDRQTDRQRETETETDRQTDTHARAWTHPILYAHAYIYILVCVSVCVCVCVRARACVCVVLSYLQTMVYGCQSLGFLTCKQMLTHAIARRVSMDNVRVCVRSRLRERNLLHQGLEPVRGGRLRLAFQWDVLYQLSYPPSLCSAATFYDCCMCSFVAVPIRGR